MELVYIEVNLRRLGDKQNSNRLREGLPGTLSLLVVLVPTQLSDHEAVHESVPVVM